MPIFPSKSEEASDMIKDVHQTMLTLLMHSSPVDCMPVEAALSHLESGGQKIRAKLALDACHRLNVDAATAIAIAACCELLHNASLVHDDLHDRDTVRRGAPTVWVTYGDDIAVCVGDLLLSAAYCALSSVSVSQRLPAMMRVVHQRVSQAIRGQCADLMIGQPKKNEQQLFHSNLTNIHPHAYECDDYETVAINKSGALLSLPLELALIAAGSGFACNQAQLAANAFAIGYQINDDLEDVDVDASRKHETPTINIVSVLANGLSSEKMLSKYGVQSTDDHHLDALNLGLKHLESVKGLCQLLPADCGYFLSQLAMVVQEQLAPESIS
jgi:geranylgeranyl pyrophosphate synthase